MAEAKQRRRNDAGMTLIEVLVSMGIFAMVMAVVTASVITLVRTMNEVQVTADAQSEIRLGLAEMNKQMRSGNVLFSPADEPGWVASCEADDVADQGSCMRIFTQTNRVPRCVQWQVLEETEEPGGAILRTRDWSPDWKTTGDVSSWHTTARGLSLDSAELPFTLVQDETNEAYGRRLLNVDLLAWDAQRNKNTTIESSISGRNTSYGYDSGQCLPVPPV